MTTNPDRLWAFTRVSQMSLSWEAFDSKVSAEGFARTCTSGGYLCAPVAEYVIASVSAADLTTAREEGTIAQVERILILEDALADIRDTARLGGRNALIDCETRAEIGMGIENLSSEEARDEAAKAMGLASRLREAETELAALRREQEERKLENERLVTALDQIVEIAQGDMDLFDTIYGLAHDAKQTCTGCFQDGKRVK